MGEPYWLADLDNLVLVGLEQMRRRLSWRKWCRNGGCLTVAIPRTTELEWLKANRLIHGLPNASLSGLMHRRLGATIDGLEESQLNRESLQTALFQFYEEYRMSSDRVKFVLWYGESLDRLAKNNVSSSSSSWVDLEIERFRQTYFRATHNIDFRSKLLDDASLWYFTVNMFRPENRLTVDVNSRLLDYANTLRLDGHGLLRDPTIPRTELVSALGEDDRDPAQFYLKLAMLLNAPPFDNEAATTIPIVTTMRLAFEAVRRVPSAASIGVQNMGSNMLRVIDRFEWSVGWRARGLLHGYHRLTPVANAVQLTARQLTDHHYDDDKSGLISDNFEATFERIDVGTAASTTVVASVIVTSMILTLESGDSDNDDNDDGHSSSFFMLHENNNSNNNNNNETILSVFVRPDTDPIVTHTLVNDFSVDNLVDQADAKRQLRWVVVVLSTKSKNQPPPTSWLMMLLRDVELSLSSSSSSSNKPPKFHSDEFLSVTKTTRPAETASCCYESVTRWPPQRSTGDVCREMCRDGVLLLATPRTGHYAPAMSRIFWQTERGLVPWSLNRPDCFTWKCLTVVPVDHVSRVGLDQVSCIAQYDARAGWYALTDRSEIVRFLTATPNALDCVPAVRILDQPLPVAGLQKVAAKRIFALADGTLFVARRPLKLSSRIDAWMPARAGKYLRNTRDCVLTARYTDAPEGETIVRGDLLGSEIWFPLKPPRARTYGKNVPREIIPLIEWIDLELAR